MKRENNVLFTSIFLLASLGAAFSLVYCVVMAWHGHWDQATFWLVMASVLYPNQYKKYKP